jgi:hypothetical protein
LDGYENYPEDGDSILKYKGNTFKESFTDYLSIEWCDSPKGINDTYK